MRRRIGQILRERGELTFRELCAELNCHSVEEIDSVKSVLEVTDFCQIGDCCLHGSTILYPHPSRLSQPVRFEICDVVY